MSQKHYRELDPDEQYKNLPDAIANLFRRHHHAFFEDGMDSPFSEELMFWVEDWYGHYALWEVADQIQAAPPVLAGEAITTLGRIAERNLQRCSTCLAIITAALHSPSPHVRDRAGLALTHIGDKRLATVLQRAIQRETIPSIKELLQQSLEELESDT